MSNVYVEPRLTIKVTKLVEDDEHRPVNKPVDLPKPDPVKVDDPLDIRNTRCLLMP